MELTTENPRPVHIRARPVAHVMLQKTYEELDLLEEQGIIEKVSTSGWVQPVVAIPGENGEKVPICGELQVGINPAPPRPIRETDQKCLVVDSYRGFYKFRVKPTVNFRMKPSFQFRMKPPFHIRMKPLLSFRRKPPFKDKRRTSYKHKIEPIVRKVRSHYERKRDTREVLANILRAS